MRKNPLKSFIIPLIVGVAFFVIQAFMLISYLGVFSVIEDVSLNFRKTDQEGAHLLKGQKISATFRAADNNLGILLIPLVRFGDGVDKLVFRIKKDGEKGWYHGSEFFTGHVEKNKHFPLGFPPIVESKNNMYVFEIQSLNGKYDNGVGIIKNEPARLTYRYSQDSGSIVSFITKKLIYVLKNINYLQIIAVFPIVHLIVLLMKRIKPVFVNRRRVLLKSKNYYRKRYEWFGKSSVSNFRSLEKKTTYFIKQTNKTFVSTGIYVFLFNSDWKRKLIIGSLIFLLAFTYRFSSSLVYLDKMFYATLGGGGDYDQFIRAATCSLGLCSRIIHQNLIIESLILGMFYNIFGFIGGLKAYLYLMLTVSSIVATLPYILFSRKTWLSIGGIIGSLFLATSDFLTEVALNFPPDNGSTFIFSMFFIVYLLTMHFGTIRWLVAFGLMGLFDGMFKAMFLINDVVVLALFTPVFFYEKTKKNALTLGRQLGVILKRRNIRMLLLALLPLLIFLILYSAWEYFVKIKFTAPYFLRLLIQTGGSNFRFETLFFNRGTGEAEQDLIFQLFYLLISGLVVIKRIINVSDLHAIFLAPIFLGLLFFSFINSKAKMKLFPLKLGTILALSFANIVLLVSIRNNYLGIHEIFPGEYIYANWTLETYIGIFLLASIIFLSILNFRYQVFKLALPILPYIIMIIILAKNAPWERLLSHIVVWSIILFSFLISWILANIALSSNQKIKKIIGLTILILFISFYSFPKTQEMIARLNSGLKNMRTESEHLRWVNSSLPGNAIILGGGKSDLITLGENISKPIVYNTLLSGAVLIKPNKIPGISPDDFTLIDELKNKDNFKKNKYIILEGDIDLWQSRVSGVGDGVFTTDPEITTALRGKDYSIKVFKSNLVLSKSIYELTLKEEE